MLTFMVCSHHVLPGFYWSSSPAPLFSFCFPSAFVWRLAWKGVGRLAGSMTAGGASGNSPPCPTGPRGGGCGPGDLLGAAAPLPPLRRLPVRGPLHVPQRSLRDLQVPQPDGCAFTARGRGGNGTPGTQPFHFKWGQANQHKAGCRLFLPSTPDTHAPRCRSEQVARPPPGTT